MTLKLKNRQVINIGNSLLITLPPEWTNHHLLHKGDSVIVMVTDDEDGRSLVLKPRKEKDVQGKTQQT